MRTIVVVVSLLVGFVGSVRAENLSEAEVAGLRAEVASMTTAFERGEPDELIERTYPALYELAGGQEAFATAVRQAVEQLRQTGITFVDSQVGTPTQLYPAGDEEVCFVPRTSMVEIQGKKFKSTTFMVAIRNKGGKEWKYLDGAGLIKNPDYLYRFLPGLQRGIELPPNGVEPL